eukprot:s1592_g8.t1
MAQLMGQGWKKNQPAVWIEEERKSFAAEAVLYKFHSSGCAAKRSLNNYLIGSIGKTSIARQNRLEL